MKLLSLNSAAFLCIGGCLVSVFPLVIGFFQLVVMSFIESDGRSLQISKLFGFLVNLYGHILTYNLLPTITQTRSQ